MASGMKVEMQIDGLRELQAALKALPVQLQRGPTRSALMSGAKITRVKAKATAAWQDDTGFLREAIVSFPVKKNEHEYTDQVRIGVKRRRVKRPSKKFKAAAARRQRRQKKKIVTPYYWRYLEFGTSRMAARPFMRPAFESTKSAAARRITERLRQGVEEAAQKVAK